ncbi:MAG: hypothetical protein KGL39_52840 [Patescibacteria group bacterium]|nr:hypothetical protein [Patescibacteria group bacterium]
MKRTEAGNEINWLRYFVCIVFCPWMFCANTYRPLIYGSYRNNLCYLFSFTTMKIDTILVTKWFRERIPDARGDSCAVYIAQRAAYHALEEAANFDEEVESPKGQSPYSEAYQDGWDEGVNRYRAAIRAMKGEK